MKIEDQVFTSGFVTSTNGVPDAVPGINAALAFGGMRDGIVRRCTIYGASGWWGLKLSDSWNFLFEDCTFSGGSKRAVDIVRGGNHMFRRCRFLPGLFRPVTKSRWDLGMTCDIGMKASVRDVTLDTCSLNDLLLGDYDIYDQIYRPETRRINLVDGTNSNGGPIIARERRAWRVNAVNTALSELHWPPLLTSAYFLYERNFGDTRKDVTPDEFLMTAEQAV